MAAPGAIYRKLSKKSNLVRFLNIQKNTNHHTFETYHIHQ